MQYVINYDTRNKNETCATPWKRRFTTVIFERDSVDNLAEALHRLKKYADLAGEEIVVRNILEDKASNYYSKYKEKDKIFKNVNMSNIEEVKE